MSAIRVLVADDDPIVLAALRAVLASDLSLVLVATAVNATEAVDLALLHQPDVALLDVRMPGGGVQAGAQISRLCPSTHIIALTAYADRRTILAMLGAGARSYLVKGASAEQILAAIHRGARHQGSVSAEVAEVLIESLAGMPQAQTIETERRSQQIGRVTKALQEGWSRVQLQPIVDLRAGWAVGAEALLRVEGEPRRGPDVWLAEAASVGLGEAFERAAVSLAVVSAHALSPELFISVNISPGAILEPRTRTLLDEIAPERLVIEVTEHDPIEDYDELMAALRPLRARGARVAVDDAGAGYASFRHILRLQPDIIKLDISIVQRVTVDEKARALAAALISFAGETRATLVAEGIETLAQAGALRTLGVIWGQGYLLGRPAPPPPSGMYPRYVGAPGGGDLGPPLVGLGEKNTQIALLRTAIEAGSAGSVEAALHLALERICFYTGWPVGHACLLTGEPAVGPAGGDTGGDARGDGELVSTAIWHLAAGAQFDAFRRASTGLRFGPGVGLPGRTLEAGERVLMANLELDPRLARSAQAVAAGLQAGFGIPLAFEGRTLGVLEFFSMQSEMPDESLLVVLDGFASELARVLDRQRVEAAYRERTRHLDLTEAMTHAGSCRWEPERGAGWFSDELRRIAGFPVGTAASFDDFLSIVHPDDLPAVVSAIDSAARGGVVDFACRFVRPDGTQRRLSCRVELDANPGATPALTGVFQDVTELVVQHRPSAPAAPSLGQPLWMGGPG
ncbi:MAG TPA: EAL domain-containing protein [Actinomycetota bacterium]|nr:EAL domain-containing protein [Actinomycetota bacterium]